MNIIIGLLTGIAASMGLGGGFILLIYLSAFTDTPQDIAQGINLLFFLPIAFLSICIHAKNKMIEWRTILQYLAFGVIGAAAGCAVGYFIDTSLLRKMFAVLLIFVGIKDIFHKRTAEKSNDEKNTDSQ